MLAPRKIKRRKQFRPDVKGLALRSNKVSFGEFGLKAVTGGWLNSQQIEAARRVMTRFVKRGGKIWIRVFPHQPITQKGSQATMGQGKGVPEYYVAVVKPGTVIFEMGGVSPEEAKEAMNLAGYKLSVKTKFIER